MAGPLGAVVLSLNASAIYAGQAVGGGLGGLPPAHGPSALPLGALGCVLAALVFLALSARSARRRTAAAPATPDPDPARVRQIL
ncbi:hypothetical protein ACWDSD_14145 [Streptomyces spiralis]